MKKEEIEKIILVAKYYYEQSETQDEIARIMGLSRPTISRMLKKALEEKYVKIQVVDPFEEKKTLAEDLKKRLQLSNVIVIKGHYSDAELLTRALAFTAADYISKIIESDFKVGIGWGRTLNRISEIIENDKKVNNLLFLPLLGGIGQIDPSFQVHNIVRSFAKVFDAEILQYHMPGVVSDLELREKLIQTDVAQAAISEWDKLDLAIIGLGQGPLKQGVISSTYFSDGEKEDLANRGAVGDICMRFFNISGEVIRYLDQEIMGIDLNSLRKTPEVIAVAGGVVKAEAIVGASRGKYIDTLITDEFAALNILENNY